MDRAAAALSLIAFGVTAFGAALPHFFGARSREIRWVTALSAGVAGWLAAQSWGFMTGSFRLAAPLLNGLSNLCAGVFLGFAMLPPEGQPARRSWLAVAAGLAMIPVAMANHYQLPGQQVTGPLLLLWQVGAWGGGGAVLMRNTSRRMAQAPREQRALAGRLGLALASIVPVILISSFISGRVTYGYLFPLLMMALQFLLVIGIARLQFYDIEVRANRASELAAAASEADRMAVIGELASTMAHEIRNPMTGIHSLAQTLQSEEVDDARRRRYAGVIVGEARRVETLVATLLDAARSEPRPASSVPLVELFADLRLLVDARARKKGVALAVDAGTARVVASRDALSQSLLNLLINAIAHSPAGGTVRLRSSSRNGVTEIAVEDDGKGIESGEAIWKPFFSGTGSTGIGLAVVERTARSEGWHVRAENRAGGGARFTLAIPEGTT